MAFAACAIGLGGADGGVLWVVAGVWTVRSVWGSPPGYAWGLTCLGIAARWGTLSIGDIQATARIFGPAATAGPFLVHAGMVTAIAAAMVSEARIDGLRSAAWAPRVASFAAGLALVALAAAPGPGDPDLPQSLAGWGIGGAAIVGLTLVLNSPARRLPPWLPPVVAAVGVAAVVAAS